MAQMQAYLKIVGNGQRTARDLTIEEATEAIEQVFDGRASSVQVAAFMAALRIKEESAEELAVFASALRRYSERIALNSPKLVDICLPYDGRLKTPSLIAAAAMIAAAGGAKIALHARTGQKMPPKFGNTVGDILAVLGVAVDLPLRAAATLIEDDNIGVGFVSPAQFAPRLEQFNSIRFDFGMRSFFNTIEKLINPFGAPTAIAGVFHGPVLSRVAGAMKAQNYQRGIAVQGPEGSIDILTSRRSGLIEFQSPNAELVEWSIDPEQFGWWERSDMDDSDYKTLDGNARLTQLILNPACEAPNHLRRGALMTAALMLYAANQSTTIKEALDIVTTGLNSGEANQRLARLKANSHAVRTISAVKST